MLAPRAIFSPAEGLCVIMTLERETAGPVVSVVVTLAALNPAFSKTRLTDPQGCPIKLGITKACTAEGLPMSRLNFGEVTV